MSEHPILFSGPMVRAILEGRKTQTRRVIKPQPANVGGPDSFGRFTSDDGQGSVANFTGYINCQYGQPGDRLWVRETWMQTTTREGLPGQYLYRADGWEPTDKHYSPWRPSIFMLREASRITLEVLDVRVERLQEISRRDVQAEGIDSKAWDSGLRKEAFAALWEKINGKRAPWASNPRVWVVEFNLVEVRK